MRLGFAGQNAIQEGNAFAVEAGTCVLQKIWDTAVGVRMRLGKIRL